MIQKDETTSAAVSEEMEPKKPFISKKLVPYLFLLPVFIYYAIFWLLPVLQSVIEVFTDFDGNFTLLGNFRLMYNSDLFTRAVFNTATFAAVSVLLQYVIAMTLAILLSRKFTGAKLLMFVTMIPMAITPTAVAIIWKTGLVRDGWLNTILMQFNIIDEPFVFMNLEGFAVLLMIIIIDTWTVTPSVMIILIAGLQSVQKELKEAAYLFGADKWQVLKDVVIPILKPSIITSVIMRLIAAIQVWAIAVMVLGFGKVPFLVERVAFYVDVVPGVRTSSKIAFTLSFTTTIIVLLATIVFLRVSRGNKAYGGEE